MPAFEVPPVEDLHYDHETPLPPPRYHLSMNIEMAWPEATPFHDRLEQAASFGARSYGFWRCDDKDLDRLLEVQHRHGMECASFGGTSDTGWAGGLIEPDGEQAYLDEIGKSVEVAARFQARSLICFVGVSRPDLDREAVDDRVITGLRKAAAIAEAAGVKILLESLNRLEYPKMAMLTAEDAYRYAQAVNHPAVGVDFDCGHRQLGEGNVLGTLADGFARGLIGLVEVADVPGRYEPGTGETNYENVFRFLRRVGYAGPVGLEHKALRTPEEAWNRVRILAGTE